MSAVPCGHTDAAPRFPAPVPWAAPLPPLAQLYPSQDSLSPAPKAGHQLSIGSCLGLQLLLSGQVEQDFQ